MLVLTRKVDESITIDNGRIVITVLGVEGDKIKLGISAPREVPIMRTEVYVAIQDQNKLAAQLAASQQEPPSFQNLRDLLSAEAQPDDSPEDPEDTV